MNLLLYSCAIQLYKYIYATCNFKFCAFKQSVILLDFTRKVSLTKESIRAHFPCDQISSIGIDCDRTYNFCILCVSCQAKFLPRLKSQNKAIFIILVIIEYLK